jgi:hypothetical protein
MGLGLKLQHMAVLNLKPQNYINCDLAALVWMNHFVKIEYFCSFMGFTVLITVKYVVKY